MLVVVAEEGPVLLPGYRDVTDRENVLLGRIEQRDLGHEALAELGVGGRRRVGPACEEVVLDAPELCPELVVDVAGSRPSGLPTRHEVAERAGTGAPLGRGRDLARLCDDCLLREPGSVSLRGLFGELRLAPTRVRRPRGGETVPEVVIGGAVDPGECLPLVEQRPEPVDATAPVTAQSDLLGLGDHGLLGRLGLLMGLRALGLAGLVGLGEHGGEALKARHQAGKVAYRVRVNDR